MKCVLIGGTGMVGKKLIKELEKSEKISKITLLGRSKVDQQGKVQSFVVDFDKLSSYSEYFKDQDVAISCLGTTRAQAGSAEQFVSDLNACLEFAKTAKQSGAKHFMLVTATGSNPNSLFLYPKTKGTLEENVKNLGFDQTSIFRPGLLTFPGDSRPKARFFEGLAISFVDFFGIKTGTCDTQHLAKVMLKVAENPNPGIAVYENQQILDMLT